MGGLRILANPGGKSTFLQYSHRIPEKWVFEVIFYGKSQFFTIFDPLEIAKFIFFPQDLRKS
uniref:Uncharacterized protein n=1 Tax=viral metagenome TaxID=1070528 RepID=A0A6C0AUF1_9ZZZZ